MRPLHRRTRRRFAPGDLPAPLWVAVSLALLIVGLPSPRPAIAKGDGCPEGMNSVDGVFCIDRYEASTVEMLPGEQTRPHSPFESVNKLKVKAVSQRGVRPQAYISRHQAQAACENAGKRLCTDKEWVTACRGRQTTLFPYGDERKRGYCNDAGVSPFNHYYGSGGAEPPLSAYNWANMNDARLNQLDGSLAPTGAFKRCRSSYGAYDMVGNLHEWTSAASGTFRGGYYLDTWQHGDGCSYRTTAHAPHYHDYSTGFRCCK
jgi:formylglycine-generating enzyme